MECGVIQNGCESLHKPTTICVPRPTAMPWPVGVSQPWRRKTEQEEEKRRGRRRRGGRRRAACCGVGAAMEEVMKKEEDIDKSGWGSKSNGGGRERRENWMKFGFFYCFYSRVGGAGSPKCRGLPSSPSTHFVMHATNELGIDEGTCGKFVTCWIVY